MPSYLDLAVLAVVLISALLALLRGFTREVLAILSWVAAGAVAYGEYRQHIVLPYVHQYIPKDNIAQAVAIALVFFGALIVVSLVTVKLSDVILDSKIGALDRTLGFVFGAVRGFLLAVVAFVFYGWLTPDANQPIWVKTARLKPILEVSGEKLHDLMPQDVEALFAAWKPKKNAPASEAPPEDSDEARPVEPTTQTPDKRTENTAPSVAPAHSSAAPASPERKPK